MAQAKPGNTVKVHYTGKLEDGTVFDSSVDREPLEFTIGNHNVIPGFEIGIVGMAIGDKKTLEIPPDDGYGPRRDDLTVDVDKKEFPEDITPEIGQQLQVKRPDGGTTNVVIAAVEGDKVTLDANHPLAGKALTFDVELVEMT